MKRICFVHVPKCGGVSFNTAIRKVIGVGRYSYRNFTLNASKTQKHATKHGLDVLEYRESLLVEKLKTSRIRFAGGHFRCSDTTRNQFENEWAFVTILRDPVKRWISQFFYNKHKKSSHAKVEMSLDEYLKSDIGQDAGADYVKFLNSSYTGEKDQISRTIQNLEKFNVVAILENQQNLLNQFETLLGQPLPLTKRNSNPLPRKEISRQVTDHHLEQIYKICAPDMEVYNHFLHRIS